MDIEKIKLEKAAVAKSLHQELNELVLYAGVGPKIWSELIENIEKKRLSRIEFIIDFFEALKRNEWRRMKEVWELPNMTSEMWHNYKILFSKKTTLIEMRYMNVASKELVAAWVRFKEDLRKRIIAEREGLVSSEPSLIEEARALDGSETTAPT